MQVEIYDTIAEDINLPVEMEQEALALARELGLAGQEQMVSKRSGTEVDGRSPYREMFGSELFAYKMLCPEEHSVQRYSRSPIPLRVLQVLAHAKTYDLFKDFVIWDKQDPAVKDPILVGIVADKDYSWRDHFYILARWGEELDSLEDCVRKAIAMKREEVLSQLKRLQHALEVQTPNWFIARGHEYKIEVPE